jgi:Raf kinase inhibitor-like YbhB/YbcL family protein
VVARVKIWCLGCALLVGACGKSERPLPVASEAGGRGGSGPGSGGAANANMGRGGAGAAGANGGAGGNGVDAASVGTGGSADGAMGDAAAGSVDAPIEAGAVDALGDNSVAELRLESDGFYARGADVIFYASACYPEDQSPPFTFVGVPATAKSLAFTFVDRSNGATKWVVWDIPPTTAGLPANLSKTAHPRELPAATQRGSLGRTGYSGPGVAGPPLHVYDFRLYALDVAQLPGTEGASTATIRTELIPQHLVGQSPIFTAKGQLGGSGQ